MTFREAAASYHAWQRKRPRGRGSAMARRIRREYELEEIVMPRIGDMDVLAVPEAMDELESDIRSAAGFGASDAWVAGIVKNVWAVLRHRRV